jgi:flotillin
MVSTSLIVASGVVVFILALAITLKSLYIQIPPNTVGIFYGRSYKVMIGDKIITRGFRGIKGGGKLRIPFFEKFKKVDIRERQLEVEVAEVPNLDGVLINLTGVASIKPDVDDEEKIGMFVERFLEMPYEEQKTQILETLKGAMRELAGSMTVEEMIKDREKLNQGVLDTAADLLAKVGWKIDHFPIQEITAGDDNQYIIALGQKKTAEVKRDADIARAKAESQAKKETTTADKEAEQVAQMNEKEKAEAIKDTEVKKATYKVETETEDAKAEIAKQIETAKQSQNLTVEEQKVEEAKQKAMILVNKQKADAERELKNAEIVVPAQAKADEQAAEADGDKRAAIARAEGVKQARELEGKGEGSKIEAIGRAEAEAIKAKLLAEAEGIEKRAEAYKKLTDAGQILMIVDQLSDRAPDIVESFAPIFSAVASPLSNIEKVTVYDAPGGDNKSGLTRFAEITPSIVFSILQQASAAGIDFSELFKKLGITAESLGVKPGESKKKPGKEEKTG